VKLDREDSGDKKNHLREKQGTPTDTPEFKKGLHKKLSREHHVTEGPGKNLTVVRE